MLVLLDLILLAVVASCSGANLNCTFETGSCEWTNDPNNWLASWQPSTGRRSHSQQKMHSSTQLCLKPTLRPPSSASSTQPLDFTGRLYSPLMGSNDQVGCLKFAYLVVMPASSNRKQTVGRTELPTISVLRRHMGACQQEVRAQTGSVALVCENFPIWRSQPNNNTSEFRSAVVDLSSSARDYKLILEGTIPAGYPDARICVDNITSYTEPCSALEPKPVKPASSLNWAHYFGMIFIAALALGLIIPILFLVIIIFVCRRRHQYRHSNFANSKLFSTNLWHYIGGKEVAEDPFAEHTTSFHRPPFMGNKFGDGTLAMRNGDMMDLPDVVIPGGRVVSMGYNGGTLGPNGTMRHQSAASFNGYPYGSATMTMGKPMMGQPGMGYMQPPMSPNMAASQHNAQTMFQPNHFYNGNADPHVQPQQQMTQQPQQMQGTVANNQPPRMQAGAVQQAGPAVVPPSNYFRSLTQAVEDHPAPATHAVQPVTAAAPQPVVAHPPVSSGDHAANSTAPFEDNGPFVLPDPPSDGGHPGAHVASVERDQADALEALNSATEVSVPATATAAPIAAPRPVTTTTATSASTAGEAVYTGEHPPPGYDEAVGMVPSRRDQQKAALPVPAASAVAPVLPPRRAGAGGQFAGNGQPESAAGLSLAERYGLPVADI